MFIQFLTKTTACCLLCMTIGCGSHHSDKAIFANLTPNMGTLSETHTEIAAGDAMRDNENSRMFNSDVRNALLLDKPSTLNKLH